MKTTKLKRISKSKELYYCNHCKYFVSLQERSSCYVDKGLGYCESSLGSWVAIYRHFSNRGCREFCLTLKPKYDIAHKDMYDYTAKERIVYELKVKYEPDR